MEYKQVLIYTSAVSENRIPMNNIGEREKNEYGTESGQIQRHCPWFSVVLSEDEVVNWDKIFKQYALRIVSFNGWFSPKIFAS